jgi:hypothetical protein
MAFGYELSELSKHSPPVVWRASATMWPMTNVTTEELEAGLPLVAGSPSGSGTVELIVRRPEEGRRETLSNAEITVEEGLVGDNWRSRGNEPDLEAQLTLMNARYANLISGDRDRWPLAGDQIYVDFDLGVENLSPGTRLGVGSAVVVVSSTPHTGCAKFRERFGRDALRFANSDVGRAMRLRGVNTRVVQSGSVQTGDVVEKL